MFDSQNSSIEKFRNFGLIEAEWVFQWLQESNCTLDSNWEAIAPYMTVCKYTEDLTYAPQVLLVHSKSGQREVFGDKWADNAAYRNSIPDKSLSKNAAAGFRRALRGEIVVEEVQTVLKSVLGTEKHTYARIISTISSPRGSKLFAFYGKPLHRVLLEPVHGEPLLPANLQQSNWKRSIQ